MLATAIVSISILSSGQGVPPGKMLPTGKRIAPIGAHADVGSYPVNMALTPDRKFVLVTTVGFRQFLSVVRTKDGQVVDRRPITGETDKIENGLYYGLAFDPARKHFYVSRGAQDRIDRIRIANDGLIGVDGLPIFNRAAAGARMPLHPAGLDTTSDGRLLVVANNQTTHELDYRGSVSIMDAEDGRELHRIPCSGFPLAVAVLKKGPELDQKAYVASERDSCLDVVELGSGRIAGKIAIGAQPVGLAFSPDHRKLYVANSGSDTVSVVNTHTDKVVQTIMLRPSDLRGLPGAGPTGLCTSPDGSRLYVALGDMNAVAVVDAGKGQVLGYVPTGWLPTSVVCTSKELLVACAKGVRTQHPNNVSFLDRGQYIQDLIEGTVTRLDIPDTASLARHTATVIACNRLRQGLNSATHSLLKDPGIEHVIYVIKENRTYDNVLGDLPQGNGDPKVCLFPRKVTPNQHALAERFVLMDNFHVCAEVSQDGWVWSTAGMISAYGSRNTPYNYSGRGRNYDTEGGNNGIPVDLIDLPDVSRPASGYIWEHCKKHGVSYRNYGFFTQFSDPLDKRYNVLKSTIENMPTKKLLQGMTNTNYRRYDLRYADSPIYDEYEWSFRNQLKTYGKFGSRNRFDEWKREFDGFVKAGKMPRFQMVRMGQDHTAGTQAGMPSPESMVADNDYAVGCLVEAVSKSPFWKTTAICVLEDDAQAGWDHVDAHRSIAFVISPFIPRGTVDHRFYNTDSMLRTMQILLGMPPMSQYDAVASPIAVFGMTASNAEPYTAIKPSREIVCKENKRQAYRSKDSERISRYIEESLVDEDLNDILWGAVMGAKTPRPAVRRGWRVLPASED